MSESAPQKIPASLPPPIKERLDRIWSKAYAARDASGLTALYAEWAKSYDEDHEAIGFVGHRLTVAHLLEVTGKDPASLRVLDLGAGTGAAGVALCEVGVKEVHGVDLSEAMLEVARKKNLYASLRQADLARPLDAFDSDTFDATVAVGFFSYGQAPAHAMEEMARLTGPGGHVAFTARDDFWESDEMGVRSYAEALVERGRWKRLPPSEAAPYLPKKDPSVTFRVHLFEVLPHQPDRAPHFMEAVHAAFSRRRKVYELDHSFIWDATATRLYDAYTGREEYYLTDCEEEILRMHAPTIAQDTELLVELGCGSARKITHLLRAARERHADMTYMPIDISEGAVEQTVEGVRKTFGDTLDIQPLCGHFDEMLARIPKDKAKTVVFFGGSLGNIESVAKTRVFLRSLRDRLTPHDRLVVGFDLIKDHEILESAYNAGAECRAFFLHMVRRLNWELGAHFDLESFELGSRVLDEKRDEGVDPILVSLRVVTRTAQRTRIEALGLEVEMEPGDAVEVGISRKFRADDLAPLAASSGMRLRTIWPDTRHWFRLCELVRDDAPAMPEGSS